MAPSTLAELVAPLGESEFLSLLHQRKITLLRGERADRYRPLLNWDSLQGMIARGEHPANLAEFRLSKESMLVPPERWLMRAGNRNVVDPAKIQAFMAQGFSLVVTRIDEHAPHLKTLCDNIRAALHEQIKIGVVVTTGQGGAYSLHHDPEDLIILQVEGSKRWKIFGPAVKNPVVGMAQHPPPENDLLFDEVLQAGDFLFVPGGNWHRCENGPERSLHLGIFFQPPTASDAIKSVTADMLARETYRIPLTRLNGDAAVAALEAQIKEDAIAAINRLDLRAFAKDWSKPS